MGFGNQLFQLAQGIIANEQKRKQLELQEDAQKQELQQAAKSFQMRQQELAAREGFLKVQQDQAEFNLEQAKDPVIQEKRSLENEILKTELDILKAKFAAGPTSDPLSTSEQLALGRARQRVDTDAQTLRTNKLFKNLIDNGTKAAPEGVDGQVILDALAPQGIRTWKGLEAAIKSAELEARSGGVSSRLATIATIAPETPVGQAAIQTAAATNKRLVDLRAARAEARKVFDMEPTVEEFNEVSPFSPKTNRDMLNLTLPQETHKEIIWGQSIFEKGRDEALDTAVERLKGGDNNTLRGYIQLNPGKLLNQDGRFTKDSATQFGAFLMGQGVSRETFLDFITEFNRPSE
jgi:hypothetical protein